MSDSDPPPAPSVHPGTLFPARSLGEVEARKCLWRALHSPSAVAQQAQELAQSLDKEHSSASVIAHRAAAIALRDSGASGTAAQHADIAARTARAIGDVILEAEALYTLALCQATLGDGEGASQLADEAVLLSVSNPLLRARALVHRALVRQRLGVHGWAGDYDQALPVLDSEGDVFWESLARLNRGTALVYLGQISDGVRDLRRVLDLSQQGRSVAGEVAAFARHNLGFALSRGGDLAGALTMFEAAVPELMAVGIDPSMPVPDRAEALLMAGLRREAEALLHDHLPSVVQHDPLAHPEVLLLLARTLLANGAVARAGEVAAEAVKVFQDQDRLGWALVARGVHALAALPSPGNIAPVEAARVADEAAAGGWPDVAADVRAAAALRAAENDDLDLAEELLARFDRQLDDLPLTPQLGAAQARMAISSARGDAAAVLDHAADALQRLEERRMLLGASELRAHVTRLAEDILTRATLAALELGDLDRALEWVDRARSQALDQPPVVPPEDEQLADDLGRLRVIGDQLARKRAEGEAVTDLLIEKDELERRVRDRARTASGTRTDASIAGARQSGTTEVAYLDLGDHLVALVASDAGTRRVDLEVDRDTIVHELDALGFAMQRVGSARSPGRRRDLAARSLDHSLTTLDDALVAPLGLGTDDRVVVSPTSVLFDVPWSGLPGLADRHIAVAPALRLSRRPHRDDAGTGTLLLEGPRLSHARAELDALAEVVADPRTILGEEGTVAAAKAALPEVTIGHLACHGVFRADNPQFSSLELADGPMFVYDLESLPRVPELIVLSACQTGRSAVHVGDELLGVTASLLALGARTVVAALADVPDDLSALLMLAFHQHVRAGAGPAEALAHARRTLLATRDEPAARLTAAAFVCLGAP